VSYTVENKVLNRQLKEKNISHAYLLEGENRDEVFKDALAFSKNILTNFGENKAVEHKFESESSADFLYIQPEKNNISIDKIREMIEYFQNRPLESKYKIALIDEVECLRKESANALLKTLEEPPYYGVIILLTKSKDRVLKTISSRCQIVSYYKSKDIDTDFDMDTLVEILYKSMKKDLLQLLDSKDFFDENKDNKKIMFDNIIWFYRDILIYKFTNSNDKLYFPKYEDIYRQFVHVDIKTIENTISKVEQIEENFKINANFQLSMEELLLFIMEEKYD